MLRSLPQSQEAGKGAQEHLALFQQPLLPEHSAAMGLTRACLPAVQAAWCCQSAPTGTGLDARSKRPVTTALPACLGMT